MQVQVDGQVAGNRQAGRFRVTKLKHKNTICKNRNRAARTNWQRNRTGMYVVWLVREVETGEQVGGESQATAGLMMEVETGE